MHDQEKQMPACHGSPQPRRPQFQNFKSGNPFTSSASVETLMLCHALASDSRFCSAKPAYCTASLPSKRCAGSCSLEASCRITCATFAGSLISCPQCPCNILINVPTEASYSGKSSGMP